MKIISIILLCLLAGCAVTPTGETVITPEGVETIDAIAAVAEPLGASLILLWPSLAGVGGILAGAAGAWRKMKPKVVEAQSERDIAEAAGEATAYALEEFKKAHPDEWADLSRILGDHHGPVVESFYRALRGLPPKG